MKLSLRSLFLIGSALVLPLMAVRADDDQTPSSTTPSGGTTPGTGGGGGCGWHGGFGHGGGFGKQGGFKSPFAALGLTDAQKEQIKQILSGPGDFKSKHEAIQNVLTPDQQAKLKEMFSHFRGGFGGGWHHGGSGGKDGAPNSSGSTDSGSDSDSN